MSLPFLFEYLPEVAPEPVKLAEEMPSAGVPLTKDTMLAGLLGAGTIAAGTGLGYGAGKLLGYGADLASQRLFGHPVPTEYLPPALGVLGGLAGAVQSAKVMKKYKELLRHAYEESQSRAARGAAGE